MRKKTLGILILISFILNILSACHDDNEDYTTSANITVSVPDSIHIEKMQGTVTVVNLNNKQSYSSSEFNGTSTLIDVMRGSYSINVNGTVLYHDKQNIKHTKSFRAASSYCEFLDHPAKAYVNIIFM
ncbi:MULTISPECIES: hypothetical protein [Prevotella]|uniref:Lipoprotein n=1 Tax=Prevotella herbatica TaxID=2801997 RepID=A0ABM7NW32_9BACT|nr:MULTISPECIES: hypothetical protein [Prevotella]MDN5552835.1 hypothetical protein [Prevotella sp.]BCS84722.1 hypothetical protein prwr041_06150 [Prevotella herbatica]